MLLKCNLLCMGVGKGLGCVGLVIVIGVLSIVKIWCLVVLVCCSRLEMFMRLLIGL